MKEPIYLKMMGKRKKAGQRCISAQPFSFFVHSYYLETSSALAAGVHLSYRSRH
jgi:hypothetical protein